jgi:protoporphyrinogen oxidase
MVPDSMIACVGLEYFCFEGDGLWSSTDAELIALATKEMEILGLVKPQDVIGGAVVRQEKAYPVYDETYAENVAEMRAELEDRYPTLHLVGRNGMHRYNNQDHAMMTAMLTVRNIQAGERAYDIWAVNEDAEYHEAGHDAEQKAPLTAGERAALASERAVPARAPRRAA